MLNVCSARPCCFQSASPPPVRHTEHDLFMTPSTPGIQQESRGRSRDMISIDDSSCHGDQPIWMKPSAKAIIVRRNTWLLLYSLHYTDSGSIWWLRTAAHAEAELIDINGRLVVKPYWQVITAILIKVEEQNMPTKQNCNNSLTVSK